MNPSIQTQTLFGYVPIHVRHTKFGAQKQAQTSQKARAHFPVRSVRFLFRLCVQGPSACQGKILLKRALKATWTKSSFRAPVWAPKKGEKSPTTSKYLLSSFEERLGGFLKVLLSFLLSYFLQVRLLSPRLLLGGYCMHWSSFRAAYSLGATGCVSGFPPL